MSKLVLQFAQRKSTAMLPYYDDVCAWCIKHDALIREVQAMTDYPKTMADLKHRLPYVRDDPCYIPSTHSGQIKLAHAEITFLRRLLKRDDKAYVVYAGSAPNEHYWMVAREFPNAKFIFFDPNEHLAVFPDGTQYESAYGPNILYLRVAPTNRYSMDADRFIHAWNGTAPEYVLREDAPSVEIDLAVVKTQPHQLFICETFFNNSMAQQCRKLDDAPVYFMCDIRTSTGSEAPGDSDILFNNAQQYVWYRHMKPAAALLKFRPPFMLGRADRRCGHLCGGQGAGYRLRRRLQCRAIRVLCSGGLAAGVQQAALIGGPHVRHERRDSRVRLARARREDELHESYR